MFSKSWGAKSEAGNKYVFPRVDPYWVLSTWCPQRAWRSAKLFFFFSLFYYYFFFTIYPPYTWRSVKFWVGISVYSVLYAEDLSALLCALYIINVAWFLYNVNIKAKFSSWQDSHSHWCKMLMWKGKTQSKGQLSCIVPNGKSTCTEIEILPCVLCSVALNFLFNISVLPSSFGCLLCEVVLTW